MCNAKPGTRCVSDTTKRLRRLVENYPEPHEGHSFEAQYDVRHALIDVLSATGGQDDKQRNRHYTEQTKNLPDHVRRAVVPSPIEREGIIRVAKLVGDYRKMADDYIRDHKRTYGFEPDQKDVANHTFDMLTSIHGDNTPEHFEAVGIVSAEAADAESRHYVRKGKNAERRVHRTQAETIDDLPRDPFGSVTTRHIDPDATVKEAWVNDQGELHYGFGPALFLTTPDGQREERYFLNGRLENLDGGPAVVTKDTVEYHVDGRLHRTDGPAVLNANGTSEWWIKGTPVKPTFAALERWAPRRNREITMFRSQVTGDNLYYSRTSSNDNRL